MSIWLVLLAAFPFILFVILLFWKKTKLIWVSLITLILVGISAVVFWQIQIPFLVSSIGKGFFVALDILLIIFGAIFFLEITKSTKILQNVSVYIETVSKDLRIQVILLAWFFENFLEGTAGFGTPSTVVAPLLISLGISPISSVIIALLGNSSSVVFGAAGAPIKIGFGSLAGATLPLKAALFNSVGILVPVFMLWFLTKDKKANNKYFFEMLPFAIWSGFIFVIPSILTVFLGQEFPSILGSVIGLAIVLLSIKLKLFIPKTETNIEGGRYELPYKAPFIKTVFPYILLIVLLVLGKFTIGSLGLTIPLLVKHTFSFFNPGFIFIIVGLIVSVIYKLPGNVLAGISKQAFKKSIEPFLVIAFMSSMAQIMVNSVHNMTNLPSMIDFLATSLKNTFLPLWSPFLGAFGSFLTGSATVSNLMFGNFLATTARDLSFNIDSILALAVVGGAAGNMIALADMLAAETVVGLVHKEKQIIKGVIIPCLIYIGLVGIIGMAIL